MRKFILNFSIFNDIICTITKNVKKHVKIGIKTSRWRESLFVVKKPCYLKNMKLNFPWSRKLHSTKTNRFAECRCNNFGNLYLSITQHLNLQSLETTVLNLAKVSKPRSFQISAETYQGHRNKVGSTKYK